MIKFIVFLGNPGAEFQLTRHNIAWLLADQCGLLKNAKWIKKFKGMYIVQMYKSGKVYFLKPLSFMNKSGESVQNFLQFFKIVPDDLLVVHDDIELNYGEIELKYGGGLCGHNGLRSIVQRLGTDMFYRLRLGISKPTEGEVAAYVLKKFTSEEQEHFDTFLSGAEDALNYIITHGKEAAMKKYKKASVIK